MQCILGSGGAIGLDLAIELKAFTSDIRLVSRNPRKVNPSDHLLSADLTNPIDIRKAVKGCDVVYVVIGFEYKASVWDRLWPEFMSNVIQATEKENCKIVFFDNIYMYHPSAINGMKEDAKVDPKSKKGKIRAEVAEMLQGAWESNRVEALIARSADFYGPSIKSNSMLTETVFKPLHKGSKANWLGSLDKKHSFTYTKDAAKATALLGNTNDAFDQVWHLPTAIDPPTGLEWVQLIAHEMYVEPKVQRVSPILVKLLGLFMPLMRELPEMMYQYTSDYIFDSSKFNDRFNFTPTSYEKGIEEIVKKDYRL